MNEKELGQINLFQNGSSWLRADFHLHTDSDNEFNKVDDFVNKYINKLKSENISIGVITNHNKFDLQQFKTLKKAAFKEEIYLFPGIELSIKDGSNGVHALVIFHENWIINKENKDYINNFLDVTFSGQANYDSNNARSNDDILETIRKLEEYEKDYFLVFAHVETDTGLWGGLSGGRLQELARSDAFKEKTLAFQKVRTTDLKDKVKNWFNPWYPAEVEGSDCKSIDEIGQGTKKCFLKVGAFTFETIKYALIDHTNRLSCEPKEYKHSYIHNISFEGGVLDGKTVNLSPELNTLIGIRGSGKSSILESIRYVLNISLSENDSEKEYKTGLIENTFKSGGKAIISALNRHGQACKIERILNEPCDVSVNGEHQLGIKINPTISYKPLYFGQKELSRSGKDFEKDLVEKLIGNKLDDIRKRIEEQKQNVSDIIIKLGQLSNVDSQKKEYEQKRQDAEFRLKIFKEYGIEEKLQRRVDFDVDARKINEITQTIDNYISDLTSFIDQHEDELNNVIVYKSAQNKDYFNELFETYNRILGYFNKVKEILTMSQRARRAIGTKVSDFQEMKNKLKEEFAEIERKLVEELKDKGAQSIRPNEFLTLRKTVDQSKQMLSALSRKQDQINRYSTDLLKELNALGTLWHEEFLSIKKELDKINENQPSLKIDIEYKGDKDKFIQFMKEMFKGSRIRENTFTSLSTKYADFTSIYKDLSDAKDEAGNNSEVFESYFIENLNSLLIWQVPNKYLITYRGKELQHHSLGQRASALILFVLSQKDTDLVIIDQPEDDLDNQTIYEDVIKLVRKMKSNTQFIFATHNANFPVLGDSEQILSCQYFDDTITFNSGSIDNPKLQKEIVDIMEGGEEAFNRRKEIYQIWKP